MLVPGGRIKLIVRDGEKIFRSYLENPSELLARRGSKTECAMEVVNSYFRQRYEYQIAYDDALLSHQMCKVGFVEIDRVSFGEGAASLPILIDDQKYERESLYLEATKPVE